MINITALNITADEAHNADLYNAAGDPLTVAEALRSGADVFVTESWTKGFADEAAIAGDLEQVALCDAALNLEG